MFFKTALVAVVVACLKSSMAVEEPSVVLEFVSVTGKSGVSLFECVDLNLLSDQSLELFLFGIKIADAPKVHSTEYESTLSPYALTALKKAYFTGDAEHSKVVARSFMPSKGSILVVFVDRIDGLRLRNVHRPYAVADFPNNRIFMESSTRYREVPSLTLELMLLHELGHILGIGHVNLYGNLMGDVNHFDGNVVHLLCRQQMIIADMVLKKQLLCGNHGVYEKRVRKVWSSNQHRPVVYYLYTFEVVARGVTKSNDQLKVNAFNFPTPKVLPRDRVIHYIRE